VLIIGIIQFVNKVSCGNKFANSSGGKTVHIISMREHSLYKRNNPETDWKAYFLYCMTPRDWKSICEPTQKLWSLGKTDNCFNGYE